jgi:hypothetical protein
MQAVIQHKAAGEMKIAPITYAIAPIICTATSVQTLNARTVKLMGSAIPGNVEPPCLLTMEIMTECASVLLGTKELRKTTSILAVKNAMAAVVIVRSLFRSLPDTETVTHVSPHTLTPHSMVSQHLCSALLPVQRALQELRQTAQTQPQVQLLGWSSSLKGRLRSRITHTQMQV